MIGLNILAFPDGAHTVITIADEQGELRMRPEDAAALLPRLHQFDFDGVGRVYLDARPGAMAEIEPPDILVKLRLARLPGDDYAAFDVTWFQGPPAGTLANCGTLRLSAEATQAIVVALMCELGLDRFEVEQAARQC